MSSLNNPTAGATVVDKNKQITITGMPYTLPADGWVSVSIGRNRYGTAGLKNLTTNMECYESATQSGYGTMANMLGSAGDVIALTGDGSIYFRSGKFNAFK